jgi:hypothetical protein
MNATVTTSSDIVLSVAVAAGTATTETLSVTLDGVVFTLNEIDADHGTRLHVVPDVTPGSLSVMYDAIVVGTVPPAPVTELDRLRYRRPSRYCESDRLAPFARSEFRGLMGLQLVTAVSTRD